MEVRHLTDRSFHVIQASQGTGTVRDALVQRNYLVVKDQNEFKGILTTRDIARFPHNLVLDCLTEKPAVDMAQDIEMAYRLMIKTGDTILPVFDRDQFTGVISHSAIMQYLMDQQWLLENEIDLKNEALRQIRSLLAAERSAGGKESREFQQRIRQEEKCQATEIQFRSMAQECQTILDDILGKVAWSKNRLPKEKVFRTCLEEIETAACRGRKRLRRGLDTGACVAPHPGPSTDG